MSGLAAMLLVVAQASGAGLRVDVVDEGSDAVALDAYCALVDLDPKADVIVGSFRSSSTGPVVDRTLQLYVYKRGYDLNVRTVGPGERVVRVRLRRAGSSVRIRLDPLELSSTTPTRMRVWHYAPRVRGVWPLKDVYTVVVAGERNGVPKPAGMGTSIGPTALSERSDQAGQLLVWPIRIRSPGATAEFKCDRMRSVRLEGNGVLQLQNGTPSITVLPDHLWEPPERGAPMDAFEALASYRMWHGLRRAGAGSWVLTKLPPAPLHLLARARSGWILRPFNGQDGVVALKDVPSRRIEHWPLVDGRPAAQGSVVVPGKLGLMAVLTLLSSADFSGTYAVLGEYDDSWRSAPLPGANAVTIYHPSAGLAYGDWAKGVIRAETAKGAIYCHLPQGQKMSGTVRFSSCWPGTGEVYNKFARLTARQLKDQAGVEWRGLPYGAYNVEFDVEVVSGARRHRLARYWVAHVTEAQPARSYLLRPRD